MSLKTLFRGARPTYFKAAIVGAAAIGTLLGAASPALADVQPKQVRVDFKDLDLAREQDVKRLYSRLRLAARSACSPLNGREQYQRAKFRACFDTSLGAAVDELDVAQLSKMHGEGQRLAQRSNSAASGS